MEMTKKVLGAEHLDTLTSMNNLAQTWKAQEKHQEALAMVEKCVEASSSLLGPSHPNTLIAV
jgi:hypothetical protein